MHLAHPAARTRAALVLALVLAACLLSSPGSAVADDQFGTPGMAYSGVSNPPTSDKPQSKLWWNDGSWWADMWKTGTGWSIHRLDRAAKAWVETGLVNDTRGSTLADTMWDGTHLYIASHVATVTGDGTPKPSLSGQPAYLYRYSYAGGRYTLDSGFPTVISNNSTESLTIDQDSQGSVWATWTQVAGDATSGYTNTVQVNYSPDRGASWLAPFVLPVSNPNPAPDDISAVVAFGKSQIGVMWSDHLSDTVWWATHKDADEPGAAWKVQPAVRGRGQSDDHLNLKSLQADTSGRVFAAVKTSLNDTSPDPALPQLLLLVFKPGTGAFTQSTISVTGDCVSRPQIVLDTGNGLVRAFQTAPPTSVSGCAYSGVAGSIYEKTASMDNPVFTAGRGTPIMQAATSSNINNVTTTKQGVDSSTGLVVLASDHVAKRYWFSDRPLGPATPAPVPVPVPDGISVVGSSTTNAAASTGISLAAPSGTTAGDVLVASIAADLNPAMASVPAGWTPIMNPLSISSGARAFAYYHVVGTGDPASYSWALSSAVKWGAGITAYRGVNNTTPLDSPVVTAVDTSYTAAGITAGSVSTASDGAMLIGGAVCDCATPVFSPPTGWTERWEASAGQIAEQADKVQATAGASGTATWTMSAARGVAAWRTALKPAA